MVIGVDEVGRGCWAGPLVAAAVSLNSNDVSGLADSKVLKAKKREQLYDQLMFSTAMVGVGWVWPDEINELGLTKSVEIAMWRAVKELEYEDAEIIIDGNINYLPQLRNIQTLIKADDLIPEVSAASIVAKIERDRYMVEVAKKYPEYGFEKHVGYGTKIHQQALELYGVLPIHRTNYKPIRKLVGGL